MVDLYTEVIMGRDLILSVHDVGTNSFIDIAAQKDGGINITRETIDITTKPDWPVGTTDEAGNTPAPYTLHGVGMKKFKPGFASWTSDVNGLTTTDTFGTQVLLTACLAATYVYVQFTVGINQVIRGYALVTSANRTGPMGDASTFSANLQGTGGFVELTGYPKIDHQTVEAGGVLDPLPLEAGLTYDADSETVAVNGVALVKDVDYTIVDGTRVITILIPIVGSYATIAYAVHVT